ncbi:MAG: hypothetical protein ACRDA5_09055 [Clostridium sp.]
MKDYEKILEDFNKMTIDDLPDVDITDEQKEKARKRLFKAIDSLKKVNGDLNIDITKEEVLDLKNALGSRSEDYLNGVKHGRVLREVALNATRDDVINKYGEIIKEVFANNTYGTTSVGWMHGGILYFKIYATKDALITYSFNEFYKVVNKRETKFMDIECAGTHVDKKYYIEYLDTTIYLAYTLEKTKSDLDELMVFLSQNGVIDIGAKRAKIRKRIIIIAVLVYVMIMFILFILNHI